MIIVTGGAGFIGSAIVHELNRCGRRDIIIIDHDDHPEKENNINGLEFSDFIDKHSFLQSVVTRRCFEAEAIIHMGACSSTTETDEEYLLKNNFEYTLELAVFCTQKNIRFIYASSAATYGGGEHGYSDNEDQIERLKPLNLYGKSKHHFDLWAKGKKLFNKIVGLKYFNVYGPNEYHKEGQISVALKIYREISAGGPAILFRSHVPEYDDGRQNRDFVWVGDCVDVMLWLRNTSAVSGLFHLGTGNARSFLDLTKSIFDCKAKKCSCD